MSAQVAGFPHTPVQLLHSSVISKGSKFRKLRKLLYQKYPKYEREAPIEEGKTVIVEVIPQNVVNWGL